MALEPITRQEKIIAGKDLEPITRMEKFLKEYGGGGGASSWNDLDDRPFGEETVYGDTLTWDGNTEGLEVAEGVYYKVSDIVPTMEYCANGGVITVSDGRTLNVVNKDVMQDGTNIIIKPGNVPFAFVVTSDADGFSPGLYLLNADGMYVSSLTINGYNGFPATTVKQLDNKYLEPFETVGGDTLTWDGNTEGLAGVDFDGAGTYTHYCISGTVPSGTDVANGATITMIGGASRSTTFTDTETGFMYENEFAVLIVDENAVGVDIDGLVFDKAGIYVTDSISSLTINGYTGFPTTKLKEEYIPVDYIKQLIAEVTGK